MPSLFVMSHLAKCCKMIAFIYILSLPIFVQALDIFDYPTCANAALAAYNATPNATFLRDQNGQPTSNISAAWGISYEFCTQTCAGGTPLIQWNSFSLQFASWLLPWLSLTGQLPLQTRSRSMNLQSIILAIGSPHLIIYSLAITILNSRAINQEFRQVNNDNKVLGRSNQTELIKAIRVILIEGQSVPLQLVNGPYREFAQLLVNPENTLWWVGVAEEILATKRELSYSLVAQLIMVVIAHGLSIIDYITSPADDDTISVGLAVNSLWIWTIPVTFGWVKAGTQTSAGSIEKALKSVPVPVMGDKTNTTGRCIGIYDRTHYSTSYKSRTTNAALLGAQHTQIHAGEGLQQEPHRNADPEDHEDLALSPSTTLREDYITKAERQDQSRETIQEIDGIHDQNSDSETEDIPEQDDSDDEEPDQRTFLGFSIEGDDAEPGPIFNYARAWSHMHLVKKCRDALRRLTKRQKQKVRVDGTLWDDNDWESNLVGTPEQMSKYIFKKDLADLKVHSNPLPGTGGRCFQAAVIAIFLGWGTTGAGLLIAYKTPTVGLGCDSGAYLIYGLGATTSWILLTVSAYLSYLYHKRLKTTPSSNSHPSPHPLIPLAILLRLSGKTIASLNAYFFLVTSVLQFTNLYNNCWCSASVAGLGKANGWVILFATDAQIAAAAKTPWVAGIFIGIFAAIGALIWILGGREDDVFVGNER